MVGKRRFGLLMAVVVIGTFVLWVRLFQVQVHEHEVWAREAANLVRSSSLLPYHRGSIVDRKERLLAYDDDYYQIELDYREFRRGHPLGQIAHARSSIEMRPVSLGEALKTMEAWAEVLVNLSPNQLAKFSPEFPIQIGEQLYPPSEGLGADRVRKRGGDAHYYVAGLLLDANHDKQKRKLWRFRGEPKGDRSFLDLAAELRETTVELVQADLDRRLRDARSDLGRLGALLECGKEDGTEPLLALVESLEETRAGIEDAIADELFREATRFNPGRLETESLQRIDSRWIARVLAWDEVRLSEWTSSRREMWLGWAETTGLYRGLLEIDLSYDVGDPAQRLLTELASLYAAEPIANSKRRATDWRTIDQLACLRELPDLFDVPDSQRLMSEESFSLPFQSDEIRSQSEPQADPWRLFASVAFDEFQQDPGWTTDADQLESWQPPVSVEELAERWRHLSKNESLHNEEALRLARHHFASLELSLQREVARRLEILEANAVATDYGHLVIAEARVSLALKKERHVVRDQSSRPAVLDRAPEFDVVQLVTRWHERYAGIEVRTRTRRKYPIVDEHGTPLASGLLGDVREANLWEVLSQRSDSRELSKLQRKRERTPAENQRVLELVAATHHPEEHQGNSGIEGYLDEELSGENGYVETQGLEERRNSDGIELYKLPVDGSDVRLTLDIDLQAAAQHVLEHPILPASEKKRDEQWFANPVGAIVLLTPEGDILAAASVPTIPGEPPPSRDGEREYVRERCFTRPRHQPPGSVFKPFVALWALENLGWSPEEITDCGDLGDGGAGYESMHCHSRWGHGELDMHDAIMGSCNAYFARLGEAYSAHELSFMASEFGFGERTGIRSLGKRGGLREEPEFDGLANLIEVDQGTRQDRMKRQAGNGLAHIQATPAQVGRALCGLLMNELPNLRLIESIDGNVIPQEKRSLGFSGENLVAVHQAMYSVVNRDGGSAHNVIGDGSLPFRVAGKTGSADYLPFKPGFEEDEGQGANKRGRKHTWFGGWFPADDPKAVLVVYLHDVSQTSSHTSVYVAKQFLQSPAVLDFVGAE